MLGIGIFDVYEVDAALGWGSAAILNASRSGSERSVGEAK